MTEAHDSMHTAHGVSDQESGTSSTSRSPHLPADESKERQPLLKASVLGVSVFALYYLTRTRHFGGDDTVYATVVQRFLDLGAVERVFVHPHHLVYNPLVALWAGIVRLLSGSSVVLDAGAGVSAAAAALAVAGTFLVLKRFEVADGIAVLVTATLAVSGGMWHYATRMEVYTLAAAGVVVWCAAVADAKCSWRRLSVGFAAPWLGHSVLGLLVMPGVWLQRARPTIVIRAVAAGVIFPGIVAAAVLALLNGAFTPGGLVEVVGGQGLGRWLAAPDPGAAVDALFGVVVWRAYRGLPVYPAGLMDIFDLVGLAAAIILGALAVTGLMLGISRRRRLATVAAGGIAALIPLWLVWDVGNTEHVVAAAPLFAVLVAVGSEALPRRLAVAILAVSAAGLLVANGVGSALLGTQPHLSRTLLIADHVRHTVPADGVLVAVGVDPELRLSLPYLASRRVVDLTLFEASVRGGNVPPDAALERWVAAAAAAGAEGRELWLLENIDSPEVDDWIANLGISRARWLIVCGRFRVDEGVVLSPDGLVLRTPLTLRRLEIRASPQP